MPDIDTRIEDKQEKLHVMLAELAVTVREGFKGVHNRQDITNGRIAKVEGETSNIETLAAANERRISELDADKRRRKETNDSKRESRTWLTRELIGVVIGLASLVMGALILFKLNLG